MKNAYVPLYLIAILLVGKLCLPAMSQILETAEPGFAGISSERLASVDEAIQNYIQEGAIAGGVFLIAIKGKIVYFNNHGNRNLDGDLYQKDDIFRLASMTKAVTTVAIMQLYESGQISLDDPLYNYIPVFKDMTVLHEYNEVDSTFTTVPAKRPITIRHLLSHTAGFAYGGFNPGRIQSIYEQYGLLINQWRTTEELMNQLAKVPLAFHPGEQFLYGLSPEILGHVVEVISGMSLDEYFNINIFDPIGMEDTYFSLPESKQDRLVPVYSHDENGNLFTFPPQSLSWIGADKWLQEPDKVHHYSGGGDLSSTVIDYAKFSQMLLNGGSYNGHQILNHRTIGMMVADQGINPRCYYFVDCPGDTQQNVTPGSTFNLGFGLVLDPEADPRTTRSSGTYGWGGAFQTRFYIDPEKELIFVGMTQSWQGAPSDFGVQLEKSVYRTIVDHDHHFFLSVVKGINNISVPLKPTEPLSARDLLTILNSTLVIRYNTHRGYYQGFTAGYAGNGFMVEGGQGYIINARRSQTVSFIGNPWTNDPPVENTSTAPGSLAKKTWAFMVSANTGKTRNLTLSVRNRRTGQLARMSKFKTDAVQQAIWTDWSYQSVVETGDLIEISIQDQFGQQVGTLEHCVSATEIDQAFVEIEIRGNDILPRATQLLTNYPNPFNPETWIPYQLQNPADVMIHIYNIDGNPVQSLNLGYQVAGYYHNQSRAAYWNGQNELGEQVVSGIYFYQLETNNYTQTRKLVILK